MRIDVVAINDKLPKWASLALDEYLHRIPRPYLPRIVEVPSPSSRGSSAGNQARELEGKALLKAAAKCSTIVALSESGALWTSRQVADRLEEWARDGQEIGLLIGGAAGHGDAVYRAARHVWSLSPLTFPHALARVIVVEQLYRAWSILASHPYHRA